MINLTKEEFEVISILIDEDLEDLSLRPAYLTLLKSAKDKLDIIFEAGNRLKIREDLGDI